MAGQQSRGDELHSLHGVYIYLHIEIGAYSALLTVMYTCIVGMYTCAYAISKTDYSDKCMHAHAEDVNKTKYKNKHGDGACNHCEFKTVQTLLAIVENDNKYAWKTYN